MDIVLRVEDGRYVWHQALQIIEFIPRRRRRATITWPLSTKQNTAEGARSRARRAEKVRG